MLLGKLVDTQHGPSDTSRRTHKIPYFSDGFKSGLYLDMLAPTFPGDGWGVARCDMNTKQKSSEFRAIIFVEFICKIRMQGHVIIETKKQC